MLGAFAKNDVSLFTLEEKVNSSIHALGVLFAFVAIPSLINRASTNDHQHTISVVIYGLCYLATFTFSTLYHYHTDTQIKGRFKLLDRISIYFFIAGTYTPFVIYYMNDSVGMALLLVMWVLVIGGILFELFLIKRLLFLSVIFYLVMGWMFITVSDHFFNSMSRQVIYLIMAGVFCYTFGVIFYVWKKWRFHHAIWHIMVLAASICHFAAVWLTLENSPHP